jgi:hypothetical protein
MRTLSHDDPRLIGDKVPKDRESLIEHVINVEIKAGQQAKRLLKENHRISLFIEENWTMGHK